MTVSLAQGGEGLGACWGEEKARELLAEAGFASVSVSAVEGDPLIGCFGNLNINKRIPQLLEAFMLLRQRRAGARLLLVIRAGDRQLAILDINVDPVGQRPLQLALRSLHNDVPVAPAHVHAGRERDRQFSNS